VAGGDVRGTILVIDDNHLYRQTLVDMLSAGGYDVLSAENGHEGLAVAAQSAFELVVCDLLMPKKEGIETILELRRAHPGLKIIAISGSAMESGLLLSAARKLGADASLEKPIRRAELLDLVARLMAGQGE
jgi:two-component system, chemotaxis family, chemotaxis protein CheY